VRIVAVDTTSRHHVQHLVVDGDRWQWFDHAGAAHLEDLVPGILESSGAARAGALVVITGPGSLTGIRAGVAAVLGVASACAIPVHTAASLEVVALAADPPGGEVVAVRDAGRGGLWTARYRRHDGALDELVAPARVDAATFSAPAGVAVVRFADGPEADARAGPALHEAVLLAMSRPALDLAVLDPATGQSVRARL
jgi:tRNA threonylcarbamoyl adenosine modification protein YeaZ